METATMIQYNGYNYLVHHVSSDPYYGRKDIYHVLTNNPKWCGSLIPEICGYPNVMSKGEKDIAYKNNPSIIIALKPYYTVDFKEDRLYEEHYDLEEALKNFPVDTDSYYELVYKEPYDD